MFPSQGMRVCVERATRDDGMYVDAGSLAERLCGDSVAANLLLLGAAWQRGLVPLSLAEQSRDLLQQQGYTVAWHTYAMAHAVCPEELLDIRAWLVDCLA